MSATTEFREVILNELTYAANEALNAKDGAGWKAIFAWWENEASRLLDNLNSDEQVIMDHSLPVNLDDLLTMPDVNSFNELREAVQSIGGDAHDFVQHVAQKAGVIPVTDTISKAEFDRYQRVMATFPIRMDDENGVDGVAVWNDEKSVRNGSRVLLLSDREIKGMKAAIQ